MELELRKQDGGKQMDSEAFPGLWAGALHAVRTSNFCAEEGQRGFDTISVLKDHSIVSRMH